MDQVSLTGRSNNEIKLHEKRDIFRETIRSQQRHSMLVSKRSNAIERMDRRKSDPMDYRRMQIFLANSCQMPAVVQTIIKMSKYVTKYEQRKQLYKYFTFETLEKLGQVLVESDQLSSNEIELQSEDPHYLRRIVLGIINNYYLDHQNAKSSRKLINQLIRLYYVEEDGQTRSMAIVCLANMCSSTFTREILFHDATIVNLLRVYQYRLEDAEDVFYVLYLLTQNLPSIHLKRLLELIPTMRKVFLYVGCDLQTRKLICDTLGHFAENKSSDYFEQFCVSFNGFFIDLYYHFKQGKLPIELTSYIIELMYELFRNINQPNQNLFNKYTVNFLMDLLNKPAEQTDGEIVAQDYRKIIKSLVTIARLRSDMITNNQSFLHLMNAMMAQKCPTGCHSACAPIVPAKSKFELVCLAVEIMACSLRNVLDWPICCRQIIRCLEDEPQFKRAELVGYLTRLFEGDRLDLLSEFRQQGGQSLIVDMLNKGDDEECQNAALTFLMRFDGSPFII